MAANRYGRDPLDFLPFDALEEVVRDLLPSGAWKIALMWQNRGAQLCREQFIDGLLAHRAELRDLVQHVLSDIESVEGLCESARKPRVA